MSTSDALGEDDIIAGALAEIRRLKAENAALKAGAEAGPAGPVAAGREPIAVIGFACRAPGGGDTPDQLWQILQQGRSTITEVPAYRWPVDRYYDPDPEAPGKLRCRYGSFLGPVDGFDCKLFGIPPAEASYMDPQQRLLLELAWEALEDANLAPDTLRGSQTGVFIGQSGFDFAAQHMAEESLDEITPYVGTGCAFSPAAGRISYSFDFKGPSYVVDTACSSSLVALHNACQSLRQGESTLALVGAVNLILGPGMSINFDKVGMLCEDGVVKTFDKDAHGVVRAEGGGMVVLKRLQDALRDGDRIDGLVLGSAISQDGASSSLMAPSGFSQREVMQAALKSAAVAPAEVDVVEAHGTATALGDPTELAALLDVYCRSTREQPLLVGSVKTNFGHMEASAGIIGLIKLLLALRHEQLPPHLNFSEGHPDIDWQQEAIEVCTRGRPWARSERRRVAGLSGFGFSGTNAHVLLAEAPQQVATATASAATAPAAAVPDADDAAALLVLSAASGTALQQNAAALADWLEQHPDVALPQLCHTLARHRKALPQRMAMVCDSHAAVLERLRRFATAGKARGCSSGGIVARPGRLAVAMVCGGHGAQYPGMSAGLYAAEPVFREAFDTASAIAASLSGTDLQQLTHARAAASTGNLFGTSSIAGPLGETQTAQLAIFCVQYALARQWQAWGVEPKVLLGHSLGEYTAACLAGIFSLEDALMLVAERARLMQELTPPGAMLSVFMDEARVQVLVAAFPDAGVAAINGPGIVLVAGSCEAIAAIAERVDAEGGRSAAVPVDRAFHSPLVDAILPAFRKVLQRVRFGTPAIPVISNLSGAVASDDMCSVDYWLRHSREPVQFMQGMSTLHAERLDAFIDLSPEPVMMGLDLCYQQIRAASGSRGVWVPSLRKGMDDRSCMLDSLGKLFCLGLPLPAGQVLPPALPALRLPTYRFDRQRCWSAAAERGQRSTRAAVTGVTAVAPAAVGLPDASDSSDLHAVMLQHMALMDQYLALAEHGGNAKPPKPRG